MDKELIMQIQYIDLKYNEVIMSAEQANEMAELCKAHYREVELKELVLHCWVHSGYENCGYKEMTTEQKLHYDSIIYESDEEINKALGGDEINEK